MSTLQASASEQGAKTALTGILRQKKVCGVVGMLVLVC